MKHKGKLVRQKSMSWVKATIKTNVIRQYITIRQIIITDNEYHVILSSHRL